MIIDDETVARARAQLDLMIEAERSGTTVRYCPAPRGHGRCGRIVSVVFAGRRRCARCALERLGTAPADAAELSEFGWHIAPRRDVGLVGGAGAPPQPQLPILTVIPAGSVGPTEEGKASAVRPLAGKVTS